ncbi:hypothetical protein HDV01_003287 [Terramyces sp. JEL0728]|nr:hypothetical protein HDV01_003287 [Terramyces sp. JEL0728]
MNIKEAIESQNASVIEVQLRQFLQHKQPEHLTDELLLNLWQWQIENNLTQLECLVLESLALYMHTSKTLAKTITRTCLSQIYTNLSGKHSTISSTLKLMIAIATYSTREFAHNFNFNLKQFDSILKIRRKTQDDKMPSDIRSLYIQLVCTLLKRTDTSTRQYLLEIKNFVGAMLKDLKNDNVKTVEYVLNTMQVIVNDDKISRTSKSLLFSNYILEQLIQLYDKESLAAAGHSFLLKLCTTVGSGVCFQDSGWYGKLHNFNLSKLILHLKTSDLKQRELLISILKKCPELVQHFFDQVKFSIEPRSSVSYFANVSLIMEIVNLDIPNHFGYKARQLEKEDKSLHLQDGNPLPDIHSALQNIYPTILNKSIASKSLQSNDVEIRFAISQLLVNCFKKLERVISISTNIEWNDLILESIRNQIPDVQIILALFQKDKLSGGSIDAKELIVSHLHLLYFYQVFNTEQLRKTRFDFTKLLQFDIQSEIFTRLIEKIPDFKWNQSSDTIKKLLSLGMIFDNWLTNTILFPKNTIKTFKRNLGLFDLDYISQVLYKDSRNYKLLDIAEPGVPVIYYSLDKSDISCIKFIIDDIIYSGMDLAKIGFEGSLESWIKRMNGETVKLKKGNLAKVLEVNDLITSDLSSIPQRDLNFKQEYIDTAMLIQGSKINNWDTMHTIEVLFDQLYMQNDAPEIQEQIAKWCEIDKELVIKCGLFYMNAKPHPDSDSIFLDLLLYIVDKDCSFILENMVIKQRFLEPKVAKVVLKCLDEQHYTFYRTLFLNDLENYKPVHLDILESGLFDDEIPKLLQLKLHDKLFLYCVENLKTNDLDLLYATMKLCIQSKIKLPPIFKNSLLVSKLKAKHITKLLKAGDYEYVGWIVRSFVFHWPCVLDWLQEHQFEGKEFVENFGTSIVDFESCAIIDAVPAFVMKPLKKMCKLLVEISLWELDEKLLQILYIILEEKAEKLVKKGFKELHAEKKYLENLTRFFNLLPAIDRVSVDKTSIAAAILLFIKSILLSRKKNLAVTQVEVEQEGILHELIDYLLRKKISLESINPDDVDSVIMQCIKYRLTDPAILKLVIYLLPHTKISKLDVMITTHSAYDSIVKADNILNTKAIPENHPAKPMLLTLLYEIMLLTGKLSIDHLPKIMANYHGTLSESDICALKIIVGYERLQDTSITNYIGQFAKIEPVQEFVPVFETLNAIDIPWMVHSLNWFPSDRDILELDYKQNSTFSSGISPTYDPAFFLLLFWNILQQPDYADLHLLLESNVVGMAVMALSSTSLNTKSLAHHLISDFYDLLLESDLKERNQTLLVLSTFRNAIGPTDEEPYPKVPQMMACFVAQSLAIMLKPDSDLYPQINRFCLQRPAMDLTDVPMFYQMFYSQSSDNRKDRHWILKLILHGLATKVDFQLLKRRFVLDILQSYFVSPMADMFAKQLVFQIIFKLCDIPSAVSTLITRQGILSYLKGISATVSLSTPNKILLALPALLLRLFKAFVSTPTKWDGKADRTFYMNQFVDVIEVLVARINELENSNTLFSSTVYARITNLCNDIAVYNSENTNGLKFHSVLLVKILHGIQALPDMNTKQVVYFENDIDQLFTETNDSKRSLLNKFNHLLINAKPMPSSKDGDCNLVTLIKRSLTNKVTVEFLRWVLEVQLNSPSLLKSAVLHRPIVKVLLESLDSTSTAEKQLARTILVLIVKEMDTKTKKRNIDDEIAESADPGVVSKIKELIQYTPTPRYLLSGGIMNESYHSLELGHLLKVCWGEKAKVVNNWLSKG